MARARASFKQADMVRAVKAALACGLEVVRTEISPDGRIILVHPAAAGAPVNYASDFDRFEAEL